MRFASSERLPEMKPLYAVGLSLSGFYAWRMRGPSLPARTDAQILDIVRARFVMSDRTYGVRRVLWRAQPHYEACGNAGNAFLICTGGFFLN